MRAVANFFPRVLPPPPSVRELPTCSHSRVGIAALIPNLAGITAGMPAMFFQLMKEWRAANRGAQLEEARRLKG